MLIMNEGKELLLQLLKEGTSGVHRSDDGTLLLKFDQIEFATEANGSLTIRFMNDTTVVASILALALDYRDVSVRLAVRGGLEARTMI